MFDKKKPALPVMTKDPVALNRAAVKSIAAREKALGSSPACWPSGAELVALAAARRRWDS